MEGKSNNSLAALAFFQTTYDNNNDILEVLAEFIKYIISADKLYSFSLTDVQSKLSQQFNFKIPQFAINTALNKLVKNNQLKKLAKNSYEVLQIRELINNSDLANIYASKYDYLSNTIEPRLKQYLKDRQYTGEVDRSIDCFYEFIVNGKTERNNELFHAFVLFFQQDEKFCETVQAIQEGAIINKALSYKEINEIGNFKYNLKLFLDTEIIFSWHGYNGPAYKDMIDELVEIIEDINQQHHNSISLYYFEETKNELEQFFDAAERIIRDGKKSQQTKTAMINIINGCKTPSCVVQKKVDFFKSINKKIKLDQFNSYSHEENNKYNIGYDGYNEENDLKILDKLNKIHKLRNKQKVTYGVFHSILLTAENKTLQLSKELYDKNNDNNSYLYLAINSFDLGGILWLKLKKPFSPKIIDNNQNNYPIDYFIKSKVALSNMARNKILKTYDEIIENKDKYSEEQIADYINKYREIDFSPEKITHEKIDGFIEIISEDRLLERLNYVKDLEHRFNKEAEEKDYLVQEVHKSEEKITSLTDVVQEQIERYKQTITLKFTNYRKAKKLTGCFFNLLRIVICGLILFPYKFRGYISLKDYIAYYTDFSTLLTLIIFVCSFIGISTLFMRKKITSGLLNIFLKIYKVDKNKILIDIQSMKGLRKKLN